MASWLDGFYDNSWLKLVRYNSTLNKFQADNTAIPNVRAVADWAALQAIPKTSANDELVVHVRDQLPNKCLYIYKHSIGRWKVLDTTFGPHAKSVMWMGDYPNILTGNALTGVLALQTPRVPYYGDAVTFTNISGAGSYMRHYRFNRGCSKASGGSLVFDKAAKTLKWKAPGDTAGSDGGYGAPVSVASPGWIRLESGSPNMDMCCSIMPVNEPASSQTDSVNLSGLTTPYIGMHGLGSPIGHFNALYGNPFKEAQYPFFCTLMRNSDLQDSYPSWQDIPTDITVIWQHPTGISTIPAANTALANYQDTIQRRKDRGSHVVVMSMAELNGYSDATMAAIMHMNQRLMELSYTQGFEFIDVNSILRNITSGTISDPLNTLNLSTDQLLMSTRGAYLIAKYAMYPVLSKYLPSISQKSAHMIPYSSTNNWGNLLTNGLFTGYATVSGTKGTGVSGDLGTSWTCNRSSGSTITAVCTMPDSGAPIPRTDGYPGNWARIAISNANPSAAAGEAIRLFQTTDISSSNYTTGDIIQFDGTLKLSSVVGLRAISLTITSNTGNSIVMGNNGSTTNYLAGNLNGDTIVYNLSSMPMTLGIGTTSLNISLVLTFDINGSATVDIGQDWMLRKLV